MLSHNEKITGRQLQFLIAFGAFGTGVAALPRLAAERAGGNVWLAAGLLIPAALLCAALHAAVARRIPSASYTERLCRLLSKPVGKLLALVLALKILFCAGMEARLFSLITQSFLLRTTPAFVVVFFITAIAGCTAAKGIEARARVAEILFFITFIPLLVLFITAVFRIDLNLFNRMPTAPVENAPEPSAALGGFHAAAAIPGLGFLFSGLELLPLSLGFVNTEKRTGKKIMLAVALTAAFLLFITTVTLARFGVGETLSLEWPLIQMMDMVNLPGSLMERQDALMMSFWTATAYMVIGAGLFYAAALLKSLRPRFSPGKISFVFPCAAAVAGMGCIPLDSPAVFEILEALFKTFGVFYLFVLPVILFIAGAIHRPKNKKARAAAKMLILVPLLLPLSGCWDRVEIENRIFAVALALDTADGGERVELTLAAPGNIEKDKPGGMNLFTARGASFREALKALDRETGRSIFIGQAKEIIFSASYLREPELFSESLLSLRDNKDINRRLLLLAAEGKARDIISAATPDGTPAYMFFPDFYKYPGKAMGITLKQDITGFYAQLRENKIALIPLAYLDGESPALSGAIALNNEGVAAALNEKETRGYLWRLPNGATGAILDAETGDGGRAAMEVEKHEVKLLQTSYDGATRYQTHITITGSIGGYAPGDTRDLPERYAEIVEKEIHEAFKKCCAPPGDSESVTAVRVILRGKQGAS
ncbi:MAG: GerAB/ArcD/ProY family transporter [Clostridiales bacterium]|nr:GerAB/ArcD/ProY family transporter [Clostridiales bacterium]